MDAETKDQLSAAKLLIARKDYRKARLVLEDVDDPIADKWLDKLDLIAPERRSIFLGWTPAFTAFVIGMIIVAVIVAVVALNTATAGSRAIRENACSDRYDRYSAEWQNCTRGY